MNLSEPLKEKCAKRIELFMVNPRNPILKSHPLKGNLAGLRAFSITGDCRIIYKILGGDTYQFVDVGKHAQVY
jgi:addiction module RelE/StbE family toxin